MSTVLDIVGHFGTTFSYATVASKVAEHLRERGKLGSVANLDPEWHEAHHSLREHCSRESNGSHVFVVSTPQHYFDAFPGTYGRENAAIFMSPNTDTISEEHARVCEAFGAAVVPSEWCRRSVLNGLGDRADSVETLVVPLGADDSLAETRGDRIQRLRWRLLDRRHVAVAVHVSTDQSWPGRKGTVELLEAWALLDAPRKLIVHVPPGMAQAVYDEALGFDIVESIDIRVGGVRGSDPESLRSLYDEADLFVAPSRCEGFGIMICGAQVAGVPTVTTYATGQVDFLQSSTGFVATPVGEPEELHGEVGLAPTVPVAQLASRLRMALRADTRWWMLGGMDTGQDDWTWRRSGGEFADKLLEWMAG